jgi:hypothetical protein
VNEAQTIWEEDASAEVHADLCVEDTRAGAVHRWGGSIEVAWDGSRWVMTAWDLEKVGTCSSSCTP